MAAIQGGFLANLGRIYALYTGTFIGFTIFIGVLELLGVPNRILGYLFIFLTLGVYALIGWLARTAEVNEYYVAGRSVPAFYNGMATGADWMSAASFIGMAGSLYFGGYGGLAFVLGWTGGYVLVSILMAPYLRKFGQFTVPDFFSARYGGNVARALAVVVLITASFTYVVAQIVGVGIITARFLDIPFQLACFVGLLGILLCSMLGGMKAVTWTQVAQYIILIIAYLIPVVVLSAKVTGVPIPQIMYGQALEKIEGLEKTFGVAQPYASAFTDAKGAYSPTAMWNFFALILCLMVGTASLPHILMRYFTTPTVRAARSSVAWSLFFITLLYFTAPTLATLSKLQILDPNLATSIIGKAIADVNALEWIQKWGAVGMLKVSDSNLDGILQINEFFLRPDIIVLATPEIAGLPYVISGLVAAGGMAAAMSTADGLLLAIANALSHDLYYKMIDPHAETRRRLIVARVLLMILGAAGALVASLKLTGILGAVAWAFCFAMSGLFFPLVLGVWWKRANRAGAIAGMVVGLGSGSIYLYLVKWGGMAPWIGLDDLRFGIVGAVASGVAMVVVTLLTKAPDAETQAMVDEVRIPSGRTIIDSSH